MSEMRIGGISMDDGPIKEEQSIFSKIKDMYNRVFKKPKIENVFVSPYEKSDREEMLDRWLKNSKQIACKYGVTAQQASDGILNLSRIFTPNEMRKIMDCRDKLK